jgi:flagellar protein FlgJ
VSLEVFGPGFSSLSEREQTQRAARELESVLLAQLLSAMRKTVPSGGLFGESSSNEIFREMLDTELARQVSTKSPFGLAEAVMRSLENRFKGNPASAEPRGDGDGAARGALGREVETSGRALRISARPEFRVSGEMHPGSSGAPPFRRVG